MSEDMNGLIEVMSDKDLGELKAKFGDNTSVGTLIDGILEARKVEANKVKVLAKFESDITKTFDKLGHPEGIHNIYARWAEIEVEDMTAEAETVTIIDTPAELDGEGVIVVEAITHDEPRRPMVKTWGWIVGVNHATKVTSGTTGIPTASKRAITVYKRNKEGADQDMGNYASASKACEALNIPIGGDSAMRVLTRDGYYTEPYNGDTAS